MKKLLLVLLFMSSSVFAANQTININPAGAKTKLTLTCVAPTTYSDNSVIAIGAALTYSIFVDSGKGFVSAVTGLTSCNTIIDFSKIPDGTYIYKVKDSLPGSLDSVLSTDTVTAVVKRVKQLSPPTGLKGTLQ